MRELEVERGNLEALLKRISTRPFRLLAVVTSSHNIKVLEIELLVPFGLAQLSQSLTVGSVHGRVEVFCVSSNSSGRRALNT